MTFGGGAEICLHAARRQAHAETYIGLVEAGVGLIPAGGGTKEMLLRAIDAAIAFAPPDPRVPNSSLPSRFAQSAELATALRRSFETIALAKVSTSAAEARSLGLLVARRPHHPQPRAAAARRQSPGRAAGRDRLRAAAAAHADSRPRRVGPGYARNRRISHGRGRLRLRTRPEDRPLGSLHSGRRPGHGRNPGQRAILLDLEREAFLSLCGEPKTQERIAFTLKTGKPLRN